MASNETEKKKMTSSKIRKKIKKFVIPRSLVSQGFLKTTSVLIWRILRPLRFASDFQFKQTSNSKQNSELPSLSSNPVIHF